MLDIGFKLDLGGEAYRELMTQVVRRVEDYVASLADAPAQDTSRWKEILGRIREPLPEEPAALQGLLDFVMNEVVPCSFNTAGPGYLAYVPGGGLLSAAAAEFLAAAVNRFTGLWAPAPAAVELETQVLRWLATMMGLPGSTLGVFTTGGSMSALHAAAAARESRLGSDLRRAAAYVSTEVHHSIPKALRLSGIPEEGIRRVPVDRGFRMDAAALRKWVAADRAEGWRPYFVTASLGTVNTGAVDPVAAIAAVAEEFGLWFHADGAYGAPFRIVPGMERIFEGLDRADSLTLDPHKGFFLPYGTGVLLVSDLKALKAAHGSEGAYLPPPVDGDEHLDFAALTPELSRDWRGLRLWLPFKLHGVRAFREALAERRRLALLAAEAVAAHENVELAHLPELSLFAFRKRFKGRSPADENRLNREILVRINAPRRVMLTGTEIDGIFWLRICVLHLRTDEPRIREALAIIESVLAEIR